MCWKWSPTGTWPESLKYCWKERCPGKPHWKGAIGLTLHDSMIHSLSHGKWLQGWSSFSYLSSYTSKYAKDKTKGIPWDTNGLGAFIDSRWGQLLNLCYWKNWSEFNKSRKLQRRAGNGHSRRRAALIWWMRKRTSWSLVGLPGSGKVIFEIRVHKLKVSSTACQTTYFEALK